MLLQALSDLLGPAPVGFEPLTYIFACLVLLWLLHSIFGLLWSIVTFISGR